MPAYNFTAQFAGKVERGEKRQTIRQPWKDGRRPRAGQTAFCFTKMRTKDCREIARGKITAVDRITIELQAKRLCVFVENRKLKREDVEALARADGFESALHFGEFFGRKYGLPFHGLLIKWEAEA